MIINSVKTQSMNKQELIRNLQSSNIQKVEVIEGFKKVDEIKRQIDSFNGDGVSLILVKER